MNKKMTTSRKEKNIYITIAIFILIGGWAFFLWLYFLLLPIKINQVSAALAGPQPPTTTNNDASVGTQAWSSTGNIIASDDSRSTAALPKNEISNYITATGFDFSAIPDGAIINGITVKIEKSEAGIDADGGIVDYAVRIIQGGVINLDDINPESNQADINTFWPAEASELPPVSYTSADWGLTWTSAQIKSSDFGVAISAQNKKALRGGAAETAQIDYVTITVDYSADSNTEQIHFRWRNDDGDEAAAIWQAVEDSNIISDVARNTAIRLRIKAQNTGISAESAARTYELQWGEKTGANCADIITWVGADDSVDDWDMISSQLVEGGNTTEQLTSATSFISGKQKETSDTTAAIGPLAANAGTEIEYSIQAGVAVAGGTVYCFRLYDTTASAILDAYSVYPEATVAVEIDLEQISYRWRNDDGGELAGSNLAGIIFPNLDNSINWSIVEPPSASNHFEVIDEVISLPPTPNDSDYITSNSNGAEDSFNMSTLSGSGSYNRIDVWVRARNSNDDNLGVDLIVNSISQGEQQLSLTGAYLWYQISFPGLSLNQADLDGVVTNFIHRKSKGADSVSISAVYAEVYESVAAASFKEAESIAVIDQVKLENARIRFLVKNNGPDSAGVQDYRLQFALMAGADCLGGDEAFSDIPAQAGCGSSAACMTASNYFSDQDPTSNISSGLADPAGVFVPGKLVEDPSNQATSLMLADNEFTELEYNFQFTANAVDGGDYCFRASRSGVGLDSYTEVARIKLAGGGAGYAISGDYISSDFDTGGASIFNIISWTESKTSPSCLTCLIKLQIKTAATQAGLDSAEWAGPLGIDGDENNDFFLTSSGELINTDHNGGQWIRYKATLEGDGTDTPILEEIRLNYK